MVFPNHTGIKWSPWQKWEVNCANYSILTYSIASIIYWESSSQPLHVFFTHLGSSCAMSFKICKACSPQASWIAKRNNFWWKGAFGWHFLTQIRFRDDPGIVQILSLKSSLHFPRYVNISPLIFQVLPVFLRADPVPLWPGSFIESKWPFPSLYKRLSKPNLIFREKKDGSKTSIVSKKKRQPKMYLYQICLWF